MDVLDFLQDMLAWLLLSMYVWGPILVGSLVAWLAPPMAVRLVAVSTAVLAVLCVVEFFFPLKTGELSDMGLWFKSIFFFFECLIFAIGLAVGNLYRQYNQLKDSTS